MIYQYFHTAFKGTCISNRQNDTAIYRYIVTPLWLTMKFFFPEKKHRLHKTRENNHWTQKVNIIKDNHVWCTNQVNSRFSSMERIGVVHFRSWGHYQLIIPCYWAFDAWLGLFVVWYERDGPVLMWFGIWYEEVWSGLGCFDGPLFQAESLRLANRA